MFKTYLLKHSWIFQHFFKQLKPPFSTLSKAISKFRTLFSFDFSFQFNKISSISFGRFLSFVYAICSISATFSPSSMPNSMAQFPICFDRLIKASWVGIFWRFGFASSAKTYYGCSWKTFIYIYMCIDYQFQ